MKSQIALDFINRHIADGKTIFIRTYTRAIEVNPDTIKKFSNAGRPLFKMSSKNELLMSEGKNYVCLATPTTCFVGISAR